MLRHPTTVLQTHILSDRIFDSQPSKLHLLLQCQAMMRHHYSYHMPQRLSTLLNPLFQFNSKTFYTDSHKTSPSPSDRTPLLNPATCLPSKSTQNHNLAYHMSTNPERNETTAAPVGKTKENIKAAQSPHRRVGEYVKTRLSDPLGSALRPLPPYREQIWRHCTKDASCRRYRAGDYQDRADEHAMDRIVECGAR